MKILQINKFYHQKGRSGGVGRYLLSLITLLEKKSHKIQVFSMKDKDALPSSYSSYFVQEQDLSNPKASFGSLKNAFKLIYSFEARKKIKKLLQEEKPDIVHFHNIYHHITPSILPVIKKMGIPIVQTVHDFHLISPNYNLYLEDSVHESCAGGKYWKAAKHKCIKNSFAASFIAALRLYFEKFSKIYIKNVDYFIAPSNFLAKKLVKNGFPSQKVAKITSFMEIDRFDPEFAPGKYILCFGRLHGQKGIKTLIEAISGLKDINLKIVGDGPQREELESFTNKNGANNIEFMGAKYDQELKDIIKGSAFVVVPSISYENAPFSVIESFALGKPVIASNLGGLPEMINDGKNGLLFNPGDSKDLKEKISSLYHQPCTIRTMGLAARLFVERNFTPEKHYEELIKIYKKALDKKHS